MKEQTMAVYYGDEYEIKLRRERDAALARVKELEKKPTACNDCFCALKAERDRLRERMKVLEAKDDTVFISQIMARNKYLENRMRDARKILEP